MPYKVSNLTLLTFLLKNVNLQYATCCNKLNISTTFDGEYVFTVKFSGGKCGRF